MPGFLLAPHRTWLLLVIATAATFSVRAEGVAGFVAGAATLALAWLKGRLVILDFMEMRHAPPVWRYLLEIWLVLVASVTYGIYRYGLAGFTT